MPAGTSNAAVKWGLPIVAIAIIVLLAIWLLKPQAETTEPRAQSTPSTEWTTAPEGPAVEVNLPETPMRNAPVEPTPTPSPMSDR